MTGLAISPDRFRRRIDALDERRQQVERRAINYMSHIVEILPLPPAPPRHAAIPPYRQAVDAIHASFGLGRRCLLIELF